MGGKLNILLFNWWFPSIVVVIVVTDAFAVNMFQYMQVATGNLLKKWHAHYRGVTCMVFNDDQSLLISGSEDGCVRVWSLFMYMIILAFYFFVWHITHSLDTQWKLLCYFRIFGGANREKAKNPYEYSFHEHTLKVTDIKIGYGGCNAIIVSASEDRTCKVWHNIYPAC